MEDNGLNSLCFFKNKHLRVVSIGETHNVYDINKPNSCHAWINPEKLANAHLLLESKYLWWDACCQNVIARYFKSNNTFFTDDVRGDFIFMCRDMYKDGPDCNKAPVVKEFLLNSHNQPIFEREYMERYAIDYLLISNASNKAIMYNHLHESSGLALFAELAAKYNNVYNILYNPKNDAGTDIAEASKIATIIRQIQRPEKVHVESLTEFTHSIGESIIGIGSFNIPLLNDMPPDIKKTIIKYELLLYQFVTYNFIYRVCKWVLKHTGGSYEPSRNIKTYNSLGKLNLAEIMKSINMSENIESSSSSSPSNTENTESSSSSSSSTPSSPSSPSNTENTENTENTIPQELYDKVIKYMRDSTETIDQYNELSAILCRMLDYIAILKILDLYDAAKSGDNEVLVWQASGNNHNMYINTFINHIFNHVDPFIIQNRYISHKEEVTKKINWPQITTSNISAFTDANPQFGLSNKKITENKLQSWLNINRLSKSQLLNIFSNTIDNLYPHVSNRKELIDLLANPAIDVNILQRLIPLITSNNPISADALKIITKTPRKKLAECKLVKKSMFKIFNRYAINPLLLILTTTAKQFSAVEFFKLKPNTLADMMAHPDSIPFEKVEAGTSVLQLTAAPTAPNVATAPTAPNVANIINSDLEVSSAYKLISNVTTPVRGYDYWTENCETKLCYKVPSWKSTPLIPAVIKDSTVYYYRAAEDNNTDPASYLDKEESVSRSLSNVSNSSNSSDSSYGSSMPLPDITTGGNAIAMCNGLSFSTLVIGLAILLLVIFMYLVFTSCRKKMCVLPDYNTYAQKNITYCQSWET